jgi:hypothetical protein
LGSPKPQLPDALFEIVCWDATYTLLIGIDDHLAAAFKASFPSTTDLDKYISTLQKTPHSGS